MGRIYFHIDDGLQAGASTYSDVVNTASNFTLHQAGTYVAGAYTLSYSYVESDAVHSQSNQTPIPWKEKGVWESVPLLTYSLLGIATIMEPQKPRLV